MVGHAKTLNAGEVIDLAALGLISEQPQPPDDVVGFVKTAGGGAFSPTTEVVLERLWRLLQLGHLAATSAGRATRLQMTERGRRQLVSLLRCEEPSRQALGTVCNTLKLCFLELLAPDLRREVGRSMVAASERRVDELRRSSTALCDCPAGARCLARAARREELELAWLREVLAGEIQRADAPSWPDDHDRAPSRAATEIELE